MDEQIIKTLSDLFDNKLKPIIDSQERMEKKLDSIKEQTADLTEFRTETNKNLTKINSNIDDLRKDITNVEIITSSNWNDIAKSKAIK